MATRLEILSAAWASAREHGLAGLTLRDVADRVGMQSPSLYSHFASKHDIYDAMFAQAWQSYDEASRASLPALPAAARDRLVFVAEHYFDFAVTDVARYQLMNVNAVPGFTPSAEAYAIAQRVYTEGREQLPVRTQEDYDIYTALIAGLLAQQLANDPGGTRWRQVLPRVIHMFADDLGLPPSPSRKRGPS